MTDEEKTVETPEVDPPEDERKFTQTELDAIVQKRLNEEKSRREREDKERVKKQAEAERIAALQGEERVKAEYESKLRDSNDQLAAIKRELAISKAETLLSAQGLPKELAANLIGETDEVTKSNIDLFTKSVESIVAQRVNDGLSHGTPPASGGSPSVKDAMAERLDRVMGIKR